METLELAKALVTIAYKGQSLQQMVEITLKEGSNITRAKTKEHVDFLNKRGLNVTPGQVIAGYEAVHERFMQTFATTNWAHLEDLVVKGVAALLTDFAAAELKSLADLVQSPGGFDLIRRAEWPWTKLCRLPAEEWFRQMQNTIS